MKILHIYRSEPSEEVKQLAAILSEDREEDSFDLNVENPDYDALVEKLLAADKAVTWF